MQRHVANSFPTFRRYIDELMRRWFQLPAVCPAYGELDLV
jgi:hypothetical protein